MSKTEAQKRANKKYLENVKRITLDLDPNLYDAIYELACSRSLTISALIRELVSFHVEV